PAVIFVLGFILEPGLEWLPSGWRGRIPDPGRQCRDTLRLLVESGLERPASRASSACGSLLRLATPGIVPDPRHANHPKSRVRHTLQRNNAIRFATDFHLEIPVRAKDGHDVAVPLLDLAEGCMSLLHNRSSPSSEHVGLEHRGGR